MAYRLQPLFPIRAPPIAALPANLLAFIATYSLPTYSAARNSVNSHKARHRLLHRRYASSSASSAYVPTIGLELHVQLKSPVKLFSPARTSYEHTPNSNVHFYDAALPGTLPVLNPEPVKLALRTAIALGCTIHRKSRFDRKHYFYPDLPAGFQITQKYSAFATNGLVHLTPRHDGLAEPLTVRVTQIQLEQDTSKSIHDPSTSTTLVDINRSNTPLIEIISEPDMHSPAEAAAYVKKIQEILRCTGSSDASMEKGSLRIDVNVSISKHGEAKMGTRCEIKNLNSVRSMQDSILFEMERQAALLKSGQSVEQETRGFDATNGTTHLLRSKADAPDYRYMPDPELAPLIVPERIITHIRDSLPELPDKLRERLETTYGLGRRDVDVLVKIGEEDESTASDAVRGAAYFEKVVNGRKGKRNPKKAANWILHELLGQLSRNGFPFAANPVDPEDLGVLIDAVADKVVNTTVAKSLLAQATADESVSLGSLVGAALKAASSSSASATDALDYERLAADIIRLLPEESEKIRRGNKKVLMRLVGEGMKQTGGKADVSVLREALEASLQ